MVSGYDSLVLCLGSQGLFTARIPVLGKADTLQTRGFAFQGELKRFSAAVHIRSGIKD